MASPRVMMPQVQVPGTRQGEGRVGRRPETHFDLMFKPFQIQPFCCFPVLPGETVMNCNLMMQAWTDPLKAVCKNQVWHAEAYFYYVKFRDMPGYEDTADGLGKDLIDMFETNESLASHQSASYFPQYACAAGGVDFIGNANNMIVEQFWRDEGETANGPSNFYSIDGVPIASVNGVRRDVHDHLTTASAYLDRRQNLDFDASGTITVDDIELAYRDWAAQKDGEMDMDYEDWVRAAGGKAVTSNDEREPLHRVEELMGVREYMYPTNTVEPTTGTPSVAVGFRWRKGQRKMFRLAEWGWVIGVICVRPKLLSGTQFGSYTSMMQLRDNWFPPNMDPRSWSPHLSMVETVGPLKVGMDAANIGSYIINLRDLLRYGEQFTNYSPVVANGVFSSVPDQAQSYQYPKAADVMACFTDTANGRIRASGVVQMGLKTHRVVVAAEEPESMQLAKW